MTMPTMRARSLAAVLCVAAAAATIPLSGSAAASAATDSPGSTPAPLRVMALGDSNTYGFGGAECDYAGYRGPLQRMLRADGRTVDFVGSVRSGFGTGLDPDHEGWIGAYIATIDYYAAWWVTNARPD